MAGGTEFLLQIQQRLTGANPASELQKTEQALKGAMDRYKELEKVSVNAGKAVERAAAGVADAQSKLDAAKGGGNTAQIDKLTNALQKAQAKEKEVASAASSATAALKAQEGAVSALAGDVEKLKTADNHAAEAEKNRAESLEATAKTGDGLNKLGGPLGRLGNQAKEVTEGWRDLTKSIGTGPAAFAVAAVAVVALAAVLIAGAIAAARFALGQADIARSARLTQEAFLAQVGGGMQLTEAMKDVEKSTGIASDRQRDIIKSLQAANVAAGDIPSALQAIAKQEAALGDSSGTQGLIDNLKSGKTSVDELASDMESKFGGIARKKMLSLDAQSATLSKNIGGLFAGINIEPFLLGLAKIVALFDTQTESGKALKALLEGVFQPLSDAAAGVLPTVERFFLGFVLGALKVGIAVKKMAKAFDFDLGQSKDWPDVAEIGAGAAAFLAVSLAAVGAAFAAIGAAIAAPIAAFYAVSNASHTAGEAIGNAMKSAADTLRGLDWAGIGLDIIRGLAAGITSGVSLVTEAASNLGKAAGDAIKSSLKIQSPSKVTAELGGYTAEGFAQGVDEGTGLAQDAMTAMVAPPDAQAVGGSRGGVTVTIGQIVISGVAGAAEMVDQLASELEARLISGGGVPAPAGGT